MQTKMLKKLNYINDTKGLIKNALNQRGANITDEPFRDYANKINELPSGDEVLALANEPTISEGDKVLISPIGVINDEQSFHTPFDATSQSQSTTNQSFFLNVRHYTSDVQLFFQHATGTTYNVYSYNKETKTFNFIIRKDFGINFYPYSTTPVNPKMPLVGKYWFNYSTFEFEELTLPEEKGLTSFDFAAYGCTGETFITTSNSSGLIDVFWLRPSEISVNRYYFNFIGTITASTGEKYIIPSADVRNTFAIRYSGSTLFEIYEADYFGGTSKYASFNSSSSTSPIAAFGKNWYLTAPYGSANTAQLYKINEDLTTTLLQEFNHGGYYESSKLNAIYRPNGFGVLVDSYHPRATNIIKVPEDVESSFFHVFENVTAGNGCIFVDENVAVEVNGEWKGSYICTPKVYNIEYTTTDGVHSITKTSLNSDFCPLELLMHVDEAGYATVKRNGSSKYWDTYQIVNGKVDENTLVKSIYMDNYSLSPACITAFMHQGNKGVALVNFEETSVYPSRISFFSNGVFEDYMLSNKSKNTYSVTTIVTEKYVMIYTYIYSYIYYWYKDNKVASTDNIFGNHQNGAFVFEQNGVDYFCSNAKLYRIDEGFTFTQIGTVSSQPSMKGLCLQTKDEKYILTTRNYISLDVENMNITVHNYPEAITSIVGTTVVKNVQVFYDNTFKLSLNDGRTLMCSYTEGIETDLTVEVLAPFVPQSQTPLVYNFSLTKKYWFVESQPTSNGEVYNHNITDIIGCGVYEPSESPVTYFASKDTATRWNDKVLTGFASSDAYIDDEAKRHVVKVATALPPETTSTT